MLNRMQLLSRSVGWTLVLWIVSSSAWGQNGSAASAVDASRLPASTLLVTNEAELRGAARLSAHTDINILVDRRIVITKGVSFPKSDSVVRILGVNESAEIRMNMRFDGDWSNPAFRATNGIEFNCRQAIVRGITVSGYEWLGSAIKGHVSELLDISKCRFQEIGTIQFPHKSTPPKTANDTLYNQAVGAHHLANAHVSVSNCTFKRCALNNHRWSHCIYVSAGSVTVADNQFTQCGNPFAVAGRDRREVCTVVGNTISDPQPVEDANGVVRPPYLASLSANGPIVFAFNKCVGAFSAPWTGHPNPAVHCVDFNDYSEMQFARAWGSDTGRGKSMSFDQWRELGFDVHSSRPQSLREKAATHMRESKTSE